MISIVATAALTLFSTIASASPSSEKRSVSVLSTSTVNSFTPYTQFARAAYCDPSLTKYWNCGEACSANSDFIPYISGGDGSSIQFYFVGFWPSENTVVVAHQGTDPLQLESDLTDADIFMTTLDPILFPNLPDGIEVHEGFANEHAITASTILSSVSKVISDHGATSVTLVGHSLGGALALLDTALMAQNLPSFMQIKMVTYGMPRVGNPAFADYISSSPRVELTHINNDHDLIPIVPGRFLGFAHPVGEVHISSDDAVSGTWYSCSGEDDATDSQCVISTVPNIFVGNILDHLGPYNGVYIGTIFCT